MVSHWKHCICLKPFEEITKLASTDKECISYVIPTVTILMTYLSKRNQELDSNCQNIRGFGDIYSCMPQQRIRIIN